MHPLTVQKVHSIKLKSSAIQKLIDPAFMSFSIYRNLKQPNPTLKPLDALIWTSFRHQYQASEVCGVCGAFVQKTDNK